MLAESFRACSSSPIADSYSPAGVGAGERVDERRLLGDPLAEELPRLFETVDAAPDPAGVQVDLAEARERARADGRRGAALERLGVQVLGELELVEPERNVRLEQLIGLVARVEPVAR